MEKYIPPEKMTVEQIRANIDERFRAWNQIAQNGCSDPFWPDGVNMNLVRKINSAFIITLPVFKQALTQAIMLKRQRIQAEAMSALDAKTNEMLIRNAQNTAEQAKMTARLASGSSIKIETLEKTWQTIVSGIDETRQIQENARKQRIDDQKRLEAIKSDFNARYSVPDKK